MLNFIINENPITKKNSSMVVKVNGRTMVLPSKQFREYEKKCKPYMPKLEEPISDKINMKCLFYLPTRRKTDITNLLQAICDILVKYKVLEDDNYTIIDSFDGTRAFYDKENPRTEIYITKKD